MALEFTEEQEKVIIDNNHNLLVSASAGSGKTTVMIERIIHLLLKYKHEKNPLSISNFLVVTFTKASASDMKQKLIKRLLEEPQDEFIIGQIEKVATSDISNLHSFCSRLISSYFYEIGVDPAVHIIDDIEGSFLKNKALDRVFEQKEKNGDASFYELFDIFQRKRDDSQLRNIILNFEANIKENLDGEKWFFDSLERCYDSNLQNNYSAQIINSYVVNRIKDIKKETELLLEQSNKLKVEKLSNYLIDLYSSLGTVNEHNSVELNAKNIFDIKIKAAPKLSLEFLDLETQSKAFSSKVKNEIDNFKTNFVSSNKDVLVNGIIKTKEIVLKLYNLYKEFNCVYETLKKEVNGVDFNDLQHYALKILSNNEICESVKQKYRYVLVDEYQDINAVQEKIISLVSSKNNRFMVGDVKQSIYRFRFCDPEIFLEKFEQYEKDGDQNRLIKLNSNFRSDKKILKFVDHVFSGVMTKEFGEYDYKENALFKAGDKNLDNNNAANLCFINYSKKENETKEIKGVYSVKNHQQTEQIEINKAVAEAVLVAEKIKDIMQSRNDISFADFAVLVASRNENIYKFIETLQSFGILVVADKKYDLMQMKHIQEIVSFVKLAVNKNDDFILFKTLKSRMFNFTDDELATIRENNKTDRFFEVFYDFDNQAENQTNYCELCKKITDFKIVLNKYSKLAKLMQIKEFVSMMIDDFSLKLINMANENGVQLCKDIDTFLNILPNVDVLDYVNLYSNFSLMHESECNGNAVKVMTIHKSKGIEFKYVFLINLSNEINLKSTYQSVLFNKHLGVGVDYFDTSNRIQQPSLPISAIRLIEKRKLVEEQQRVLYVAMTRAVEKLFVICTAEQEKLSTKFPKRPVAFIDWFSRIVANELQGNHCEFLNFEKYEIEELLDVPEKDEKQLLFWNKSQENNIKWFEYEYSSLKNIPLKNSITQILNNNCEDDSYENKYVSNEFYSSAERGTLYHNILRQIDLKNLEKIDNQLSIIKEKLSLEETKIIDFEKIKNIVNVEFFNAIKPDDIIFQEKEFYAKMPTSMIDKNSAEDEFILQGVIDLIIIKNDEVWVLDYKTGRFSEEKMQKYKIQIDAYAKVCERVFGKIVTKKAIYFIDEQKNIEF